MTVGTVLPFDRLIRAMDGWASRQAAHEMLAQIGEGAFEPEHMRWRRTMTAAEFDAAVGDAALIVAHAGMGSITAAAAAAKPIVILPRTKAAKEHTSDHQVHTAARLRDRPGIYVADSERDIEERIRRAMEEGAMPSRAIPTDAPREFIQRIREFLVG